MVERVHEFKKTTTTLLNWILSRSGFLWHVFWVRVGLGSTLSYTVIDLVQKIVNRDQSILNRYIHLCKYPWMCPPAPPPSPGFRSPWDCQIHSPPLEAVNTCNGCSKHRICFGSSWLQPPNSVHSSYCYLCLLDNCIVIIRSHLCHRFLNVDLYTLQSLFPSTCFKIYPYIFVFKDI